MKIAIKYFFLFIFLFVNAGIKANSQSFVLTGIVQKEVILKIIQKSSTIEQVLIQSNTPMDQLEVYREEIDESTIITIIPQ